METASTDLVVSQAHAPARPARASNELWAEPLDTPGVIPHHLTRSAAASSPLLEILQRILYRLRPTGTGDLERALALLALYQAIRPAYGFLRDMLLWACTVQITVQESDPAAKEILAWMGAEVVQRRYARSAMLVTGGLESHDHSYHQQVRMTRFPTAARSEQRDAQDVVCLPPLGTRLFWIGYRPFLFSRSGGLSSRNNAIFSGNPVDDRGKLQNALTLITPGWSLAPLRKFIESCHEFKRKNLHGTTTVYYAGGRADPYGDAWQSVSKAVRKLDTIDMDEEVKSDIIRDAEYYYSEESRQFFADCGIPYRRGYLFHGPPGTGKSSFSAALAGHLQCDIYHINLSSGGMSDGSLHRLFLNLPRKCVVVIEDIDSAGVGREQGAAPQPPPGLPDIPSDLADLMAAGGPELRKAAVRIGGAKTGKRNTVTLSGLLNAIDGNASQEGRLLIMTSNNPDALDDALIRPGRVDKKVYFGNMNEAAGKSIFMRLIGRSAIAHDAAFSMAEIEQYAVQFAAKVPANTFTPADIQGFLQGCRGDPDKALRDIDAWVAEKCEKPSDRVPRTNGTSPNLMAQSLDMDASLFGSSGTESA